MFIGKLFYESLLFRKGRPHNLLIMAKVHIYLLNFHNYIACVELFK